MDDRPTGQADAAAERSMDANRGRSIAEDAASWMRATPPHTHRVELVDEGGRVVRTWTTHLPADQGDLALRLTPL